MPEVKIILRVLSFLLLGTACLAMQRTDPVAFFERTFELEEYTLTAQDEETLKSLIETKWQSDMVAVVQGTACISGGPQVARNYASMRGREGEHLLLRLGVPRNRIRPAEPRIFTDEPRREYRRLQIVFYATPQAAEEALRQEKPTALWLYLLIPVALILLFSLIRKIRRPANLLEHQLTQEEGQALATLTGGMVVPLPTKEPTQTRKKSMARKKETRITPISIRGALSRGYETRTLAEISRSPVSALEGLTPRHARLLEEAFGVRTVEDLASLRYVEIARAIAVLSRYES